MANEDFAYAVARIRVKENSLFTSSVLEQLLSCKTYDEALRFLLDRGWAYPDTEPLADAVLNAELKKSWDTVEEMVDDMSLFDVMRLSADFHNLKAAIKLVYTDSSLLYDRLFISNGTIEPEILVKAIREKDYSSLPEFMTESADEAYNTLLHTGDGQLCDMIIDKASLKAIYEKGKNASVQVLRDYAEVTVAAADIKVAVRCAKTGKSVQFISNILVDCETLDIEALAHAAGQGIDAVTEYLETTAYSEAAEYVRKSMALFECWCDNCVMKKVRSEKYNSFTIGPLVGYLLAKETEIKSVRMILSGKLNNLPDDIVRERLREMYV